MPGYYRAGGAKRSYPMSEARGGCREEQPHVQGAVASWAQEDLEELLHDQGKEVRRYPLSKVKEIQVRW